MVNCKARFELRKDNKITTETRLYRACGNQELLGKIRSFAEDASRRGYYVEMIATESIGTRTRLIAWTALE